MSARPEEYLEIAMARQTDLILACDWDRLLRPERPSLASRASSFRTSAASLLRWLADRLQPEPGLVPARGS